MNIIEESLKENLKVYDKTKKFYTVLALLLILLIPIMFLSSIVDSRESYRDEAVEAVKTSWAKPQAIIPPNLTLKKGNTYHYLKLNNYNVHVKVNNEIRKKGVFPVPVYTADVNMKGDFFNNIGSINNQPVKLDFSVSDSKGFIEQPKFKLLNGELVSHNNNAYSKNITTSEKLIPFELQYKIRGLNMLSIIPAALNNVFTIEGNWNNPSFDGDFLPTKRNITNNNFTAEWSIPAIATSSIEKPIIDVSFLMPVDNYRMTIRAVKYAFLFLALTFLTYFIYELTTKKDNKIHQLQYLMIGTSMLIFYLLLVSLSEFVPFIAAYLISSVMTIGLISSYTYFVITKKQNIQFALLITCILSLLYLFLYILLMLQDLSLIVGSIGLFLIMVLVMYSTRNIEWYSVEN